MINQAIRGNRSIQESLLHLLAVCLSLATLALLFVGAMVTSTNSGLSVPDWPTTFGQNMFTFPLHKMQGGILFEHGHRLFASGVGGLTVCFTVLAFFWEKRRWVKILACSALGMVIIQGVLGGMTVRFKLPIAVSSAHGLVAELFFCTTLWLAWSTSMAWNMTPSWRGRRLNRMALGLLVLGFSQVLVGAIMRHSFAGLAIPTFPKAFDTWIPSFWSGEIALNFVHTRIGPSLILVGTVYLAFDLFKRHEKRFAIGLLSVLGIQITLGILTVLSGKIPLLASLHLAGGALFQGVLFSVLLWSGKRLLPAQEILADGVYKTRSLPITESRALNTGTSIS